MKIECYASSSSGNCYQVSDGTTAILLEIGIPLKLLIKRGGKPPRFCLLSHEHGDHAKGAKEYQTGGIILSSKGTLDALGIKGVALKERQAIRLGTLEIMPFLAVHGSPDTRPVAEPFSYVIASTITEEKLLFATDTVAIYTIFKGITHFLIECNWDEESISPEADQRHIEWAIDSHMSLKGLKEVFLRYQKAGEAKSIEQVILCHLSSKNSNERKMAKEIKELTGAIVSVCQKNGGIKKY